MASRRRMRSRFGTSRATNEVSGGSIAHRPSGRRGKASGQGNDPSPGLGARPDPHLISTRGRDHSSKGFLGAPPRRALRQVRCGGARRRHPPSGGPIARHQRSPRIAQSLGGASCSRVEFDGRGPVRPRTWTLCGRVLACGHGARRCPTPAGFRASLGGKKSRMCGGSGGRMQRRCLLPASCPSSWMG